MHPLRVRYGHSRTDGKTLTQTQLRGLGFLASGAWRADEEFMSRPTARALAELGLTERLTTGGRARSRITELGRAKLLEPSVARAKEDAAEKAALAARKQRAASARSRTHYCPPGYDKSVCGVFSRATTRAEEVDCPKCLPSARRSLVT